MKRILAVDDHEDSLFTLTAIGEVADFEVIPINNGIEALELLKNEKFDLVITDYYMPEMNGLELVSRIRALDAHIPILVLTVDECLDIAQRFMDAGATDFATKPIRTADLISRINLHLELSQLKESNVVELFKENIPKGMSPQTMQLIIDYVANVEGSESIEAISSGTGLAYQTVHRYLTYLEQEGFLETNLSYGKVGRPVKKYTKKGDVKFNPDESSR